jgi:hypothetical protein
MWYLFLFTIYVIRATESPENSVYIYQNKMCHIREARYLCVLCSWNYKRKVVDFVIQECNV